MKLVLQASCVLIECAKWHRSCTGRVGGERWRGVFSTVEKVSERSVRVLNGCCD